jgi:hypothetical protein
MQDGFDGSLGISARKAMASGKINVKTKETFGVIQNLYGDKKTKAGGKAVEKSAAMSGAKGGFGVKSRL